MQSDPFRVENQTPAFVRDVRIMNTRRGRNSGMVAITYRLIDEQRDPADVSIEFSANFGARWLRCTELAVPFSEGTGPLATGPSDTLPPGIPHLFIWDSAADIDGQVNRRKIRERCV